MVGLTLVFSILHCKNSRVVLTLLWLSQLQNRYYCTAEVAIHAAKIHSLIHRHNYYVRGTLCICSWDSVYAHGTLYMLMGLSVYASANTAVKILLI